MKKLTLIIVIALSMLEIYSCKKSDSSTNTVGKTTDINQIIGTWKGMDTSRVSVGDNAFPVTTVIKKISSNQVMMIGFYDMNPPLEIDTLWCTADSDLNLTVTANNLSGSMYGQVFTQVNARHYYWRQSIHTGLASIDGYMDKQ